MITIHDVTLENYKGILELKISAEQKDFIETPYECLAEAAECGLYTPVGLHVDDHLAGFAMYGFLPEEDGKERLWIDRFLIDEKYQGKGLGTCFMKEIIKELEYKYEQQPIYLSVYVENEAAIHLYKKLGFSYTGELDINGELVMARKIQ